MSTPTPVELLAFIKQTFDMDELETLCFQLYVPFDDLAGQTREAKARELVAFMQRVGRTNDLRATLAHERPTAWKQQFGSEQLEVAQYTAPAKPRPRNPNQIFLSHAHQDADIAQRLAADLRLESYEIWIAPDSIAPGERWVDAINRALKESGVFLLVSTPNAVESQWVQDETSYAIELAMKEGIRFIRLDVAEADVPPMWSIRQHVSFQKDYDDGLERLLLTLNTATSNKSAETAPVLPKPDPAATQPSERKPTAPESDAASQRVPMEVQQAAPPAPSAISFDEPGTSSESLSTLRRLPTWVYWVGGLVVLALVVAGAIAIYNSVNRPSPEETSAITSELSETLNQLAGITPTAAAQSLLLPTSIPASEGRTNTLPSGIEVMQVEVPAGSFEMGHADGEDDERSVHTVSLDSYLIDQTEVTNAQFEAFVEETGYETLGEIEGGGWSYDGIDWAYVEGADWRHPTGPESDIADLADHPVVLVTWADAVAFCQWTGGDLPTEAQWEFAARGPESTIWPWGNEYDQENLNFCDLNCPFEMDNQDYDDGYRYSSPVGNYPDGASWIGSADMIGNVWEWVRDWYGEGYYQQSEQQNPTGPATGTLKVLRGGAWDVAGDSVGAADRSAYEPMDHDLNLGFRCVKELD